MKKRKLTNKNIVKSENAEKASLLALNVDSKLWKVDTIQLTISTEKLNELLVTDSEH